MNFKSFFLTCPDWLLRIIVGAFFLAIALILNPFWPLGATLSIYTACVALMTAHEHRELIRQNAYVILWNAYLSLPEFMADQFISLVEMAREMQRQLK